MATQNDKGDVGEVVEQMRVLREDFAKLTQLVKQTAETRGDAAGRALARRIEETGDEARLRAREAQSSAEAAIVGNPLAACAMSLGLGFVIGALMRR